MRCPDNPAARQNKTVGQTELPHQMTYKGGAFKFILRGAGFADML
jgi:hypothetical protein